VVLALAFGWMMAEKEATEAREKATAELLRKARSQALQNQLDPHVLYNALSSLSELVYEDPLAAEEAITRLADLYRMLTVHGREDFIPLARERRLVEAYLAMEQMRLGERLEVRWNWPSWADDERLPPFFLQPLVENAIKHGISPSDEGGGLVILVDQVGAERLLRVENTGVPPGPDRKAGVGLGNLEARLALWTEVQGCFTLETRGPWTVATVRWTPREDV
jgi:two-component system sensor histidine kinase AlgZ